MASYTEIINKKKREWNAPDMMEGAKAERGPKIPFSSPLMNWATYGGIPRYRITEFYGAPGSGKSTTAIDICKTAGDVFQMEYDEEVDRLRACPPSDKAAKLKLEELLDVGPRKILYLDLEHGFDGKWAQTLGIDNNKIDIMQPPDVTAEDILQSVVDLIQTNEIGLIVLDSIPSLVPRAVLEKKVGERTVAALAGLLTTALSKVVPLLTRYKATLLLINQIRDNMDNPYVVNTPGGQALKFYCSLRIYFKTGVPIDFLGNELPQSAENPAGYIVNAKLTKQKSAPWDRKNATYFLLCQSGIRPDMDYVKLAVTQYGIIKKGGAWFTICDPYTGEVIEDEEGKLIKINGMARVYDFVQTHPEYYSKLKKYILDQINEVSDAEESEDDIRE